MGRHSAPDDAPDDPVEAPLPDGGDLLVLDPPVEFGRHAVFDAPPDGTDLLEPAVEQAGPAVEPAEPAVEPAETEMIFQTITAPAAEIDADPVVVAVPHAPPAVPRRQSTAGDLALLRGRRDLLARCLAAVLAPFVVYVVIMLVIGATAQQYLLWIFLPLVTAGVLVGALLDVAHRHAREPVGGPITEP